MLIPELLEIYDKVRQANLEIFQLWLSEMVFKWQWWLGLICTILPWILWLTVRKKQSTDRLLCVGFFVMIVTSLLDSFGVNFGLWAYNYKVIPGVLTYIPWDYSLFPVTIMLLLQYKPHISPYIKGFVFATTAAFIAEPLFVLAGNYIPIHWKYVYSYLPYYLIYLAANYISKRKDFNKL